MRILFTGGSSFTGYWFVKELTHAGHDVVATFQQSRDTYTGVRGRRLQTIATEANPIWECSFGSNRFLELIGSQDWDLLCHHGADVRDYKKPEFDVSRAVASNTHNLSAVLEALLKKGCSRILVTGSVFEGGEGAGSEDLPAFSPYGLSKELSWKMFEYYARRVSFNLGKFVIPNPFGPFEEPRFTAYLFNTWKKGNPASVQTPEYVRDNIHVSLLASAYRYFAENFSNQRGVSRMNPSGYIESQGLFATRVAAEFRARTGLLCELELAVQASFSEPAIRINTEPCRAYIPDWSESRAWDEFAAYYQEQ